MKMSIGTGWGARSCCLGAANNMIITGSKPKSLGDDAMAYAACRFLMKSNRLCQAYVNESYRLRFAKGKEKRIKRHWCTAPAALMELPGKWVRLKLAVTAKGVTVEKLVFLSDYFPFRELSDPGRENN